MTILIQVTLGCGGGGHTAVFGSIVYIEHLVPTPTVPTAIYTDVSTFVLLAVVASVLIVAGKTVLR